MKSNSIWIVACFVCGVLGLTGWFRNNEVRISYYDRSHFQRFRSEPKEGGMDMQTPASALPDIVKPAVPKSSGYLLSISVDGNGKVVGRDDDPYELGQVAKLQKDVVGMAGAGHSMALTVNGSIYTWGRNDSAGGGGGGSTPLKDSGQLGFPREDGPQNTPAKLLNTGPKGIKMVSLAAGRYHSVAASQEGKVYTWGLNDFGQLGREAVDLQNGKCKRGSQCHSPELLEVDWGKIHPVPRIVQVRAARYFTMAVSSKGQVFTWGLNFCGVPEILEQVQSDEKEQILATHASASPRLIEGFGDAGIRTVDVGYVFSIMLDTEGKVWTCNTGSDGYAGQLPQYLKMRGVREPNKEGELGRQIKKPEDGLTPSLVEGLPGNISGIAAGRCFGMAVSGEGSVHHWGCAFFGNDQPSINRVGSVGVNKPHGPAVKVAAGEYHAHILLKNQNILLMGRTGNSGSTRKLEKPVILEGSQNISALDVECGNQHSLILSANLPKKKKTPIDFIPEKVNLDYMQEQPFKSYYNAILREQVHHFAAVEVFPRIHSAYVGRYEEPDAEAIEETIQDAVANVKDFDPAFKNPCYHAEDGSFRCLPYFSIIGVSKCGTTDLYAKLEKFTNFMTSNNKGPHFWDEKHPWDWYLDVYSNVADFLQDPNTSNETITSDASSNTFSYSGVGVRGTPNAKVLLPEVLKFIQPDMKVIVMLRDPVKRLFSAYWYYGCLYGVYERFGKMSSQNFHTFVSESIDVLNKCMVEDKYSARYCAVAKFYKAEQLIKGMYSMSIRDWLAVYPTDMIKIVKLEEFSKEPGENLKEILSFLNLPEPSDEEVEAALRVKANRGNTGSEKRPECKEDRGNMLPETEKMLRDFYRPFNHHLASILKNGAFKWGY